MHYRYVSSSRYKNQGATAKSTSEIMKNGPDDMS